MGKKAFQDYYPDDFNHCYGCGQLNSQGLQIRSYWDGDESIAVFTPKPYHISIPGYVYGGLIGSLIDCHSIGTASAAAYRFAGRKMGSQPTLRFVTASLQVSFLKPVVLGEELEIRGQVQEIKERKIIVRTEVRVNGIVCAEGEVIAVKLPDSMTSEKK